MNLPECVTHGPIEEFEVRRTFTATEDGPLPTFTGIVMSCGCEHFGTMQENEDISDEPETFRVTILSFTGQPVLTYVKVLRELT